MDNIREQLEFCKELMARLFESGLMIVSDTSLEQIKKEAVYLKQYGLNKLSEALEELVDSIEKRRHNINAENDERLCRIFCNINVYLELALKKVSFDVAGVNFI